MLLRINIPFFHMNVRRINLLRLTVSYFHNWRERRIVGKFNRNQNNVLVCLNLVLYL